MSLARLPTAYVTHGGGPMPLLGESSQMGLVKHLQSLPKQLPTPKAILLVTAHWEESVPTVSTAKQPGMLFDYYGFPPEAYKFKYNAPGAPAVAQRVRKLLSDAGIKSAEDSTRGYDHGTFVPLMLMYPDGSVPVVQMSLVNSLDAALHVAIGKALAPLRDEGVFIVGSGSSFHNLGALRRSIMGGGSGGGAVGKEFDDWLVDSTTKHVGAAREQLLANWARAPGAQEAHPREEHLIPLMVVAGAAGQEPGYPAFRGKMGSAAVSSILFGEALKAER